MLSRADFLHKTIFQLRAYAIELGIFGVMDMARHDLVDAIIAKQAPAPKPEKRRLLPHPSQLCKKLPAQDSSEPIDMEKFKELALPYIQEGLLIGVDEQSEAWVFKRGDKQDSGTLYMPYMSALMCAYNLM